MIAGHQSLSDVLFRLSAGIAIPWALVRSSKYAQERSTKETMTNHKRKGKQTDERQGIGRYRSALIILASAGIAGGAWTIVHLLA